MFRIAKWLGTATLTGLALVAVDAPAQQLVNNFNPYQVYFPSAPSSYWGYSWDPYGGYLHGAADVIRAQGQFMINKQQASLIREHVNAAKIENRRAQLEQWLWERENLPTPQDERERLQREEIRRSRNDPPITEIWSAKALNDLLLDAMKIQSAGGAGATPLREEVLAKINVTTGKSGGNIGLLKGGRLTWPLLLRRPAFAKERELLDRLVAEAVQQAPRGQIDAGTLEEMLQTATRIDRRLIAEAKAARDDANWTPTMYLGAKAFLRDLDSALRVLQQPDAGQYLTGQYGAKGRTIGELVQYMKENGLQFAPAIAGGEAAYAALYQALRDYDVQAGSSIETKRR